MAEKVKKEPLKTRNPYKYYRNAYVGAQAGEWACIGAPIIAIFGAKWNEYFNFTDNQGGAIKLTIGSILALVCAAIFMYKKIKHQEKTEKKVTMLSFVVGIGVAFAIAYFFKVILDDIVLILGCELAGAAAAYGLDLGVTQEMRRKQILYRDAIDKLDAEEAARKVRADRENEKRRRAVD